MPKNGHTRSPVPDSRGDDELRRAIAMLQQKNHALETELIRRTEMEQALKCRESEWSDFLENAVEPMHKLAADGKILWANKAEMDLLGYPHEQYIGRSIVNFHLDADVVEHA